jgi:hypothetical protein
MEEKDQNFDSKAKQQRPDIIAQTSWIRDLLKDNLNPIKPGALVLVLACGSGVELPHIRNFAGEKAIIHAFDILPPDQTERNCFLGPKIKYHRIDIRNLKQVLNAAGRTDGQLPDLIICRSPKIIEIIGPGKVVRQDWWIDVLTQYAQIVVNNGGQMLITTYTEEEQILLAKAMEKIGLEPITGQNELCPNRFRREYIGEDGTTRIAGIDRYTIVVRPILI